MVEIICAESGIKFEAATRRTKQHPLIAELKQTSSKQGNYRDVNNALREVSKEGEYETIEEFMQLVQDYLQNLRDADNARAARAKEIARKDEEQKAIRKAEKAERNKILKANGYTWKKIAMGTEDRNGSYGSYYAGVGEFSHYQWMLFAPDGRNVTEEQALDEIERGAETVQAEAEETAKAKAQAEAKETAKAKQATYDAVLAQAEKLTEVEKIDWEVWNEWETVASYQSGMTLYQIKSGKINHVVCYVVSQYGDMDYSRYFCGSTVLTGLTKKTHDDNGFNLSDWF